MSETRQRKEEVRFVTGKPGKKLQSLLKRQEKTLDKASRVQDVAHLTKGQGLTLTLMSSTSNTKAA